jgi:hypothetical protein
LPQLTGKRWAAHIIGQVPKEPWHRLIHDWPLSRV